MPRTYEFGYSLMFLRGRRLRAIRLPCSVTRAVLPMNKCRRSPGR